MNHYLVKIRRLTANDHYLIIASSEDEVKEKLDNVTRPCDEVEIRLVDRDRTFIACEDLWPG